MSGGGVGYRAKMSKFLEAVTRNPGKRGRSDAQSHDTEKSQLMTGVGLRLCEMVGV